MSKYEYLKCFFPPHVLDTETRRNWFCPVTDAEIGQVLRETGVPFPVSLQEFWREIGYGALYAAHDAPKGYRSVLANRVMQKP